MRRLISKITDAGYERVEDSTPLDDYRLTEILETGIVPGSCTDRELLEGLHNGNQFEGNPRYAEFLRKKHIEYTGKEPPKGAYYMSNMCRHQMAGDPEAWVHGRGDVKRVLEKRGWGADCELVSVKERDDKPPRKPIKLAEKIIQRKVREHLAVNPTAKHGELRERVIHEHGNPHI